MKIICHCLCVKDWDCRSYYNSVSLTYSIALWYKVKLKAGEIQDPFLTFGNLCFESL